MNKKLFDILKATKIPVAYRQFPKKKAPPLPYITFYEQGDNNFAADGIVYSEITDYMIELYTAEKDGESEKLVEKVLTEPFNFWSKNEMYIEKEMCYLISYEIEV